MEEKGRGLFTEVIQKPFKEKVELYKRVVDLKRKNKGLLEKVEEIKK